MYDIVNDLRCSYAMDDSCQKQLWIKADLNDDRFKEICSDFLRREHGEEDWTNHYEQLVSESTIRRTYRRSVPLRGNDVGDSQYVDGTSPARGAYPVMILDTWLPIWAKNPIRTD